MNKISHLIDVPIAEMTKNQLFQLYADCKGQGFDDHHVMQAALPLYEALVDEGVDMRDLRKIVALACSPVVKQSHFGIGMAILNLLSEDERNCACIAMHHLASLTSVRVLALEILNERYPDEDVETIKAELEARFAGFISRMRPILERAHRIKNANLTIT